MHLTAGTTLSETTNVHGLAWIFSNTPALVQMVLSISGCSGCGVAQSRRSDDKRVVLRYSVLYRGVSRTLNSIGPSKFLFFIYFF